MRKIIASFNMSLDGVIDHMEEWHFQYFGESAQEFARAQLWESDALLMGRKTYEGFAQAWPNMEAETGEFGVRMNTYPHYVVSSTVEQGDWGTTTVIKPADLVAEATKLKEQDGRNILMYGYGPVAHELLKAGVLDEVRVWLHPILAGHGEKPNLIFRDGSNVPLELAETRQLDSGVIILCYRPAAKPAAA
jgi:dihydrofolate reductase